MSNANDDGSNLLAALIVGAAVLGVVVGSFLNVVVYRVPRGESIVRPRSRCPTCGAQLSSFDNVPLISYALLRGRCRHCGAAISIRYPIVEAMTGALFAATAARFHWSWPLPAYLVFSGGLVTLGAIDLDRRVLPRRVVFCLGLAVGLLLLVASGATGEWRRMLISLACAAGWFAVFYALHTFGPRLLGFGDVRLAFVLGLGLGWLSIGHVFVGFVLSCAVGSAVGLALIATGRATRKTAVPFGPFLAVGCELTVLIGRTLLAPFHGS